ncbi:Heat shock 70 kDa protein 1 [Holothuria leucospilota]|uniref:Heat shock 70 kDa protein 1 n=1 Tax=Holothuria leucospilota TaxID=206669 RepID=A0A9Q1BY32_HOLLE|nr:Heat shock 70 kDa protein 1 [Holothuria leucospilota]
MPVIAIDFGTAYSRVGVYRQGKLEIIPNEKGNLETPNYVAFTDSEILVGDAAKSQLEQNAVRTIFAPKICIGQPFNNDVAQRYKTCSTVKVVDRNGQVGFQIEGQTKVYTPEEISAMILLKMKQAAEVYLGSKVTDAVITVPGCFLDSQRQALVDAGTIAGLNVRRLINEPTAAVVAFCLENNIQEDQDVMITSIGAGASDVSIASIGQAFVEMRACQGDPFLGGVDFTSKVVDHLRIVFRNEHNSDVADHPLALQRVITAAEEAKITLSNQTSAVVDLPSLVEGKGLNVTVTRSILEECASDLLGRYGVLITNAITDSRMALSSFRKIIAVGGTTQMPAFVEVVKRATSSDVNKLANETALYGAAIQAAILSGDHEGNLGEMFILDNSSHSVGIETVGSACTTIIPRGTTLPAKKSEIFSTSADNQPVISVQVCEGEREMASDNPKVAQMDVKVPPGPKGVPQVHVTFNIDDSGIIRTTCEGYQVDFNKGRLSKEEKDKMAVEVQSLK